MKTSDSSGGMTRKLSLVLRVRLRILHHLVWSVATQRMLQVDADRIMDEYDRYNQILGLYSNEL